MNVYLNLTFPFLVLLCNIKTEYEMKKYFTLITFLTFLILHASAAEKIAATVNGEAIYESELEVKLAKEGSDITEKQAKKIKLKRLIYAKAMSLFLKENNIEVAAGDVDAGLKILEGNPHSSGSVNRDPAAHSCQDDCSSGLDTVMKATFLDMNELRKSIANDIGFKRYIEQEWHKHIADVGAGALAKQERPRIGKQFFAVSHIFFKAGRYDSDYEKGQSKKKAENAFSRLENRETFESVALHVSEDKTSLGASGKLGCISRKSFDGAFVETVEKLNYGEYSKPIESGWGIHIVRKDKISDDDILGILKNEFTKKIEMEIMRKAVVKKNVK